MKAIKEEVGLLVGVQLTPERDLSRYDELVDLGVDHFSFCVELMDEAWFARICPGKAKVHGQRQYFSAMEHCASLLPRGAVSGEVIAGIKPIDNAIAAIDRITELGAFPTVCIFRPTVGSDMEGWPPPAYEDMRRVMAHVYDACRAHWLPIGAAPNIEVSLVVNPDDAALLAERSLGFYAYELYRRMARAAARPLFNRRGCVRPEIARIPDCRKAVTNPWYGDCSMNLYGGVVMTSVFSLQTLLSLAEHAAFVLVGFVLMVIGLGLGVTLVLLPVGLVIGLIGLAMFIGGLVVRNLN